MLVQTFTFTTLTKCESEMETNCPTQAAKLFPLFRHFLRHKLHLNAPVCGSQAPKSAGISCMDWRHGFVDPVKKRKKPGLPGLWFSLHKTLIVMCLQTNLYTHLWALLLLIRNKISAFKSCTFYHKIQTINAVLMLLDVLWQIAVLHLHVWLNPSWRQVFKLYTIECDWI